MFDHFDAAITCEEYYGETPYHDDEDDILDDSGANDVIIDDGDDPDLPLDDDDSLGRTPENYWFNENGGLTAEAQDYLGELDHNGELV